MTTKKRLHQLVDQLPDTELEGAERYLEAACAGEDLLLRTLNRAPVDDEPLTEKDLAAIEEGKAAYRRGDFVPADDAKRELLG